MRPNWWKANWWKILLVMLPIQPAFTQGWDQYAVVNGVYQRLPFSAERALIGLAVGVVFSLIIFCLIISIRFAIRKMKAVPKSN